MVGAVAGVSQPSWAQTGAGGAQPAEQPAPNCDPNDPADPDCPPGQSEVEIESGTLVDSGAQGEGQITVTGSRIRRPNVESAVPITSLAGEELFQQGQTNIGDTLNDLPQLRSTFAQQNPGAGVGIAGLNLLDLRGLGTVRTLVLVNGRRHVSADILNNASSVDVNTIPTDLVERIDVVTGGNSAVYGSDAIAGVVNFVLRRDFEGIQLRGIAAISEEGYGGNQYASILAGTNFADGRGNITGHVEYANQDRIYASDISFFRQNDGFAVVDVDSAGLPNASDGFPDNIFVRDIRSSTINRFGLAIIPQPAASPACGVGTSPNNGPPNSAGTPFSCNFLFTDQGQLTPQTGTRIGSGPNGTFLGGNGQTGREGTLASILPSLERINGNLLAHFQFSEAFEIFAEAKATRIETVGNALGPTFINNAGGLLTNDARLNPRLDNPFLNPADRLTLQNAILASNCGFTLGGGTGSTCTPLTAAQRAQVLNGSYRFLFSRQLFELGDRDEFFTRNTYRGVVGARGTFNTDWSYEISGNYGRFEETVDSRGRVDRQRFFLSLDAGRNPTTGQIQCRSQFDPAAAIVTPNIPGNAARLAADVAACRPFNLFGAGNNNEAVAYVTVPIRNRSSIDQLNFLGFVSGDSSDLFELPGGPVRFVLGAEYRREKVFNDSDPAADTSTTNQVFLGDVDPPALEVKEAFAELQIPILKDVPFFEELTVSGAIRASEYNNAVGTALAYNAGLEWSPIRDLRFRANYGRAVRAPNVTETSFPAVSNFANGFLDPCGANQIGNNATRSANCQQQLTAAQRANINPAAYNLQIISGSNANLQEETADSYTIGGVFTPRFLPGFSLTVDYYDITVNDVIVSLTAQNIINSCYDSPNLSSPLCSAFQRNLGTTNGPAGELPGVILLNSTIQGPQNFASRARRGIDFEAAYRTNIADDLRLSTRFLYTHVLQSSNFENPTLPNFENRLLSEIGDPQDEFRWDIDLSLGPVTLGYQMRYIGPQLTTTYENLFELPSACSAAVPPVCPPLNADVVEIFEYPAVTYHDLRADFRVGRDSGGRELTFYVGVDNLLNQEPPLGTTGTGAGTAIFNIRGRNYYAGFRARF
jgi:outer membrane receptor protein involved in Fe transport